MRILIVFIVIGLGSPETVLGDLRDVRPGDTKARVLKLAGSAPESVSEIFGVEILLFNRLGYKVIVENGKVQSVESREEWAKRVSGEKF